VRNRLRARFRRTRARSRRRKYRTGFRRSNYCCRLRYPRTTLRDIERCVYESLPQDPDRAIVRYVFYRAIPRLWYVLKAEMDRQRLLVLAIALAACINIRAGRKKVKLSGAYYYMYPDTSEEVHAKDMAQEYYPINPAKWSLNKASLDEVNLMLILTDRSFSTYD